MVHIIENIKQEIKNHEKVTHSVLRNIEPWKHGHYAVLANIINESLHQQITSESEQFFYLGNTISFMTFRAFIRGKY